MRKLETLLNDIPFENLPPVWTTFDLEIFSRSKKMWDYQQRALQNAIKALWKYYEEFSETIPSKLLGANILRKERFMVWYQENDIPLDPTLPLGKKRDNTALLGEYFPIEENAIPYQHFINRMCFWMATGSGKTLVIVKLIELLAGLMKRGSIPVRDMMMLTHREDLLQQLREHVNDYNAAGGSLYISLKELKEYPQIKRALPSLLSHQEITIFYYRSDNLSDEQKERIIDFRNYDNNGQWYVLLDEAHKGDKEDSKRQHIYSILARDGFLFNFSATFTDPRDILTTAAEFNLASFIEAGYGKHISILKQENRAFRKQEDYTNEEKQKIVLQSLLMLAYVRKAQERLCEAAGNALYHRPLLLALVNSVNVEEADLKLFFREIERIGCGEVNPAAFARAKSDLRAELDPSTGSGHGLGPAYLYEDTTFRLDASLYAPLGLGDVLRYVFNADGPGEIEVLVRPSNDKELAFKLKSTTAPFALIKIGTTSSWMKDELAGYEVVKGFEDESFFARLNNDDSDINLLMGSRSFYEGWDSNRPNVITFINIGTGTEARKFILQSVGRGVRIEPLKGKRKRLASLHNAKEVDNQTYQAARPYLPAVESLLIFGTNRAALETVFTQLDQEKEKDLGLILPLDVNESAIAGQPLLVPVYRLTDRLLVEERKLRKFELPQTELDILRGYVDYLGDDRLLLAHHDMRPRQIGLLQESLAAPDDYFNTAGEKKFGTVDILLPRLTRYFDILQREVDVFKPLEDEINHFKRIRVLLQDIEELQKKVARVKNYKKPQGSIEEITHQLAIGEISQAEAATRINAYINAAPEESFSASGVTLHLKNIPGHYYLPLILSDDAKHVLINYSIQVESEKTFLRELDAYLDTPYNDFNAFDWWMFSRTDESTDAIVLPYYHPRENRIRDFHPDFIFWLKKRDYYWILFVDPKGMTVTDYEYKIDGYKELFLDHTTGQPREFPYGGLKVRVGLAMYNKGASAASGGYGEFWYDHPSQILRRLNTNA
jgi:superfamily II DNA or RNA helicase